MNNMISDKTASTWKDIQKDGTDPGASRVVTQFDTWALSLAAGTSINTNSTLKSCNKNTENLGMYFLICLLINTSFKEKAFSSLIILE